MVLIPFWYSLPSLSFLHPVMDSVYLFFLNLFIHFAYLLENWMQIFQVIFAIFYRFECAVYLFSLWCVLIECINPVLGFYNDLVYNYDLAHHYDEASSIMARWCWFKHDVRFYNNLVYYYDPVFEFYNLAPDNFAQDYYDESNKVSSLMTRWYWHKNDLRSYFWLQFINDKLHSFSDLFFSSARVRHHDLADKLGLETARYAPKSQLRCWRRRYRAFLLVSKLYGSLNFHDVVLSGHSYKFYFLVEIFEELEW